MKKGFTLIELLLVVAIIGLLTSIIMASLSQSRSDANVVSLKSGMKELQKQMELKYNNSTSYGRQVSASCESVGEIFADSKIRSLLNSISKNGAGYQNSFCSVQSGSINAGTSWSVFFAYKHNPNKGWCVSSNSSGKQMNTVSQTSCF